MKGSAITSHSQTIGVNCDYPWQSRFVILYSYVTSNPSRNISYTFGIGLKSTNLLPPLLSIFKPPSLFLPWIITTTS